MRIRPCCRRGGPPPYRVVMAGRKSRPSTNALAPCSRHTACIPHPRRFVLHHGQRAECHALYRRDTRSRAPRLATSRRRERLNTGHGPRRCGLSWPTTRVGRAIATATRLRFVDGRPAPAMTRGLKPGIDAVGHGRSPRRAALKAKRGPPNTLFARVAGAEACLHAASSWPGVSPGHLLCSLSMRMNRQCSTSRRAGSARAWWAASGLEPSTLPVVRARHGVGGIERTRVARGNGEAVRAGAPLRAGERGAEAPSSPPPNPFHLLR